MNMQNKITISALLMLWLAGCGTEMSRIGMGDQEGSAFHQAGALDNNKNQYMKADQLASEAITLLGEDHIAEASQKINSALQLRTDKSYLHLINGICYHLLAIRGERDSYDLASQGYDLAIQFDPSNWMAYYFRGRLAIDKKEYPTAERMLTEAALLRPDDVQILDALAYVSYRMGKPDQAAAAMEGVLRTQKELSPQELHNYSLIMAALGEEEIAQNQLDKFRKINSSGSADRTGQHLARRLAEWQNVHNSLRHNVADKSEKSSSKSDTDAKETKSSKSSNKNNMVVVDVVIIRTEDNFATSKGVNLLNGLQIQFGDVDYGIPAVQWYDEQYDYTEDGTESTSTSTTLTRALTLPAISYTLNILNTNNYRTEILARPTLVAIEGEVSEFFSGTELTAAAVSSSDGEAIKVEKDIGVKLAVKPNFLADGKIRLAVKAIRTFLKAPSDDITFTFKFETTKSSINANVVMRVGETLILGGLSEKETQTTRDGVPVLQDIPIAQYLFSNQGTQDYQSSVLILLTPRLPQFVYQPENARKEYEKGLSEEDRTSNALRARFSDWFKPYPNWASIFHHLQGTGLYREFRTGDVDLESWADMTSLKDRLIQAFDFLHY